MKAEAPFQIQSLLRVLVAPVAPVFPAIFDSKRGPVVSCGYHAIVFHNHYAHGALHAVRACLHNVRDVHEVLMPIGLNRAENVLQLGKNLDRQVLLVSAVLDAHPGLVHKLLDPARYLG